MPTNVASVRIDFKATIATLRDYPRELGCWSSMSAHADDISVIVSSHKHNDLVSETLKEYEAVTEAKINSEKLVGLQLGGSVKLLGVWFRPDSQRVKNWDAIRVRLPPTLNSELRESYS